MACSPTEKPTGLELARKIAAAYAEGLDGLSREDCEELGIGQEDCKLFLYALKPHESYEISRSRDGKIAPYKRRELGEAGYSDEFIDELESKAFPARVEWLSKNIVTSFWWFDFTNMERHKLIGELGKFGKLVRGDAISDLIEIAGDEDSEDWYCGIFEAFKNNYYHIPEFAFDWYYNGCVSLQEAAIDALGNIGPYAKESIPLLRRLARSRSYLPEHAIPALGKIRAVEAVPDLVEMGEKLYVKVNAEPVAKRAFSETFKRLKNILPQWASDIQPRWDEATPRKERNRLYTIVQALRDIASRPEIAVPLLTKTMEIESDDYQMEESIRGHSIDAVKRSGTNAIRMAMPALIRRLNDNASISYPAAETLARLGDEVVPRMAEVIRNRRGRTRVDQAIHVLREIGSLKDEVVSLLLEVLANIEGKYYDFERADAAELLGDMGTPTAAIPLLRLAMLAKGGDAADLRKEVVCAMGRVADVDAQGFVVGDLMAALEDKDADVRDAAAEELGITGGTAIDRYYDQPIEEEPPAIPDAEPWEGDVPPTAQIVTEELKDLGQNKVRR